MNVSSKRELSHSWPHRHLGSDTFLAVRDDRFANVNSTHLCKRGGDIVETEKCNRLDRLDKTFYQQLKALVHNTGSTVSLLADESKACTYLAIMSLEIYL